MLFILCLSALLQLSIGKDTSKNCRAEWSIYTKCLNDLNDAKSSVHVLTEAEWLDAENDVVRCFKDADCQDPFFNAAVKAARRSCFLDQRNHLINDATECLRRKIEQADLPPQGNDPGRIQRYIAFVNARANDPGVCPPNTKKSDLYECVKTSIEKRSQKSKDDASAQLIDWCQRKKTKCDTPISQECYDSWLSDYKPALCKCVSDLSANGHVKGYKSQYETCYKSRSANAPYQLKLDDPHYRYFDFLSLYYCSYSEICVKLRSG